MENVLRNPVPCVGWTSLAGKMTAHINLILLLPHKDWLPVQHISWPSMKQLQTLFHAIQQPGRLTAQAPSAWVID